MRRRREFYALLVTGVLLALFLVGFFTIDVGQESPEVTNEQAHGMKADAPHQVQERPPSAIGTIEEP